MILKRASFTFLSFASLSLVSSCLFSDDFETNEPCSNGFITIGGQLPTGENSSEPLKGFDLELSFSSYAIFLSNYRLIATAKTNDFGTFRFNFKPKEFELEKGTFDIFVHTQPGYFEQEVTVYGVTSLDTLVRHDIHLPSKATLRVTLRNWNLSDSTNRWTVRAIFDNYSSPGSRYLNFVEQSGSGFWGTLQKKTSPEFDEMNIATTTAGDQYTKVESYILRNGQETSTVDSIFIAKGAEGHLTLDFH